MGELQRQRWLFVTFFRRELSSRYSGTLGGGLWALGQPVMMLAIYSFVFRTVLKVGFPELGEHGFTAFVACALWPWMAFQEGIQRATQAVVGNAGLVKKVVFPHELLVLASVAATFAIHFLGFAVVLTALAAFGEPLHPGGLPIVALGWLVLFVLATGLALMTAALQVFLKDIDHLLGPVLMVMFYLTPILYPISQVPEAVRVPLAANPLVHVLEPIRAALLHGTAAGLPTLLVLASVAVGIFLAARQLFIRLSGSFEDFL
jgi:ABC-type polysaccharide/polyol phosphate export permease